MLIDFKSLIIRRRNLVKFIALGSIGIFFIFFSYKAKNNDIVLISPNKKMAVYIFKDAKSHLSYKLSMEGNLLIDSSLMGISLSGKDLGENITIGKPVYKTTNKSYTLIGSSKQIQYKASVLIIPVVCHTTNNRWWLECELSDRGFAYRYHIRKKIPHLVTGESSSFKIPAKSIVWYFERDNSWKLKSYAGEWTDADISEMPSVSKMGPIQGPPLVIKLSEGGYLLLSEAACFNYSGMRLEAIGNNTFKANFTEKSGFEQPGEFYTPWRVVMYAENLNKLVNNTLITDLCPAPDSTIYKDRSYIEPGKSVWRFLTLGTGSPVEEKKMIDYAHQLGFAYTLIDEGWAKWQSPWVDIQKLYNYGRVNGVKIWIWKRSSEINNSSDNWCSMRAWLDSAKLAGVCGVKVDFINSESKNDIVFETTLMKEAAKRKLMVNIHGCGKPTGANRTFPNQITREAIRGLELNTMDEGPISASHNAALPFTRFIIGPADYTPFGLTAPGNTTWAQQYATLIDFNSPLQVIAEYPEFLLNNKLVKSSLSLFKAIPTVWDETIVLKGSKIGELAVMARRSGKRWFIGIINGGDKKNYRLDLSFLNYSEYKYQFIEDDLDAQLVDISGLNPKAKLKGYTKSVPFKIVQGKVKRDSIINITLAKYGGFVAMLNPITR